MRAVLQVEVWWSAKSSLVPRPCPAFLRFQVGKAAEEVGQGWPLWNKIPRVITNWFWIINAVLPFSTTGPSLKPWFEKQGPSQWESRTLAHWDTKSQLAMTPGNIFHKGQPRRPPLVKHGEPGIFSHIGWRNRQIAKICRTNRLRFTYCSTDCTLNAWCVRQLPPTS